MNWKFWQSWLKPQLPPPKQPMVWYDVALLRVDVPTVSGTIYTRDVLDRAVATLSKTHVPVHRKSSSLDIAKTDSDIGLASNFKVQANELRCDIQFARLPESCDFICVGTGRVSGQMVTDFSIESVAVVSSRPERAAHQS